MTDCSGEPHAWKSALRAQGRAARRQQPGKDELSRLIWDKLFALPEYLAAGTVMVYLNLPSEVRTQRYWLAVREQGKEIVIPYCEGGQLQLFRLNSPDELHPGSLGILEPGPELRAQPERQADVSQLDLILAPGVAFDRQGGRIGHGRGYYDRLLRRARSDTALVGLAFECQLVPAVPMLPHDVFMDKVVTEKAIYLGPQRHGQPLTVR